MSLLNRSPEFSHLYDSEGRLQGGLSALEELARVIAIGTGNESVNETMDVGADEIQPAQELPVSHPSRDSPSLLDSDEDMSDEDEPGSSDDEAMEEITMYDEPIPQNPSIPVDEPLLESPIIVPSSPNAASLPPPAEMAAQGAKLLQQSTSLNSDSDRSTVVRHPRRNSRKATGNDCVADSSIPIGEKLKRRMLDMNVLSTLVVSYFIPACFTRNSSRGKDLFFEFPWNNFLHSAVYDLVHQILTGRVDSGFNRELTIALFRDARLMDRIIEGQKRNDIEWCVTSFIPANVLFSNLTNLSAKPKGVRLGYMGHLTLISEDVIGALEHFPPDLQQTILKYAPASAWDDYVTGRYSETKKKDSCLLGGGKPVIAPGVPRAGARWKVDEEDHTPMSAEVSYTNTNTNGHSEMRGEFRRTGSIHTMRETSADFGIATTEDGHETRPSQVSIPRYFRVVKAHLYS